MSIEAGSQPQSSSESVSNSEPEVNSVEEAPETSTEETSQDTGVETDGVDAAAADTTGEEADSQTVELPRWLEDLELSEEDLARYQKRYPAAFNADAPEDLRYLLRDKVKADRDIQARMAEEEDGEPTSADDSEAQNSTAQPLDATEASKQYYASLDKVIDEVVDPKVMNQLGSDLLSVGLTDKDKANPAVQQQIATSAPIVGRLLTKAATDLMYTVLPRLMAPVVEQSFPGFGKMYERSLYMTQWENVRLQEVNGQQPYSKLPTYGTKEFSALLRQASSTIPGFDDMVFKGKNGKVLPLHEQVTRKYSILAKIASGQQVNPATIKEAVDTGKDIARKREQKVEAARALGSGQGKNQLASKPTGNEDIFGPGVEEYRRRGGA